MELPGVSQDDIHVEIHDNILKISDEKMAEKKKEGKGYSFTERRYASSSRSFCLPEDADTFKVYATYKDGLLTVHIVKLEANKPQSWKIEVPAG